MLKKLLKILLVLAAVFVIAFAVFWFSRPDDVSFEALKGSVPHSESSKFAEIDGVRVHYQEKGSGTPLVLIHGYTSSTYSWKDVFDPLAEKYRVIAVDLKGFGFSAKPDGDYTRRAQGELVAGLLDHLKIERAWVAGNSMGGETALNLALHHPEKVSGLILIDSSGVRLPGRTSLVPWYAQTPVLGRLLTALALTGDKLVREGLQKSFYDDSKIDDERISYYYQPLKTRGGQLAAMRARTQYVLHPIEDEISKIGVPTLILWGAEDEVIPPEAGRKMNSLIKDSKLTVIEKCGHLPQEEMPGRILREMEDFIGQNQ
ncbi:MAG: alpha/beta hydrolase [Pyrinomonadaceae bacterium]